MSTKFFLFALVSLTLIACEKDEPNPNTVAVNLQFDHLVDGAIVQLDQIIYKNVLQQDFSIKTIKYFISDFKIHKNDGSQISFDDIHYVDIRAPESLGYTLSKKIPAGDYAGISFIHGLSSENNITGRFSEPPESLMEWPVPMGGGYHYMKLEGEFVAGTTENFFNFHSGGLDGNSYEVGVDLTDQPFSVEDKLNIAIKMEIQHWFTNPVDWDFTYFGPGIMGNHEAQETVQKNGENVYSFALIQQL